MAVGKKKKKPRQQELWVETTALPQVAGHPFFTKLNAFLEKHNFDAFVENLCAPFYAGNVGRPGLAPGVYFRMLLIGYFEGIGSDRGIAWRVEDSLALRDFLGFALTEHTPDHSTLSAARHRIDLETHQEVFRFTLSALAQEGLLRGGALGIDTTTLEANAAMRSIVRRDTGEDYHEFLKGLAKESGIESPTRADCIKVDKERKKGGKGKASNDDWKHPHDPDARIAKMKDGSTHMAHKAEHAVDLETGALVGITVQAADMDDRQTLHATLAQVRENLYCAAQNEDARGQMKPLKDIVADKGYHSTATLETLIDEYHLRPCISEPDRGRRKWIGRQDEQALVYANRINLNSERGKALLKKRGEMVERSFAHCYESGGLRRVHVRGHEAIRKRTFIQAAAFNFGVAMRKIFHAGTPKGYKALQTALVRIFWRITHSIAPRAIISLRCPITKRMNWTVTCNSWKMGLSTGC